MARRSGTEFRPVNDDGDKRMIQTSSATQPAPLQGIRVVEFGQFIAGPAAAQALCDLGAEVVKVEPEGGDAARTVAWSHDDRGPLFAPFNRGKRSIVLDLAGPGREAAFALASQADVVISNARPGAMERAGLSADALRASNPRLIVASLAGYAPGTAFATRPGFDIGAQAESGMMSLNGESDRPPARVGFMLVDMMSAHAVTTAVLGALVRRGVTGTGATISVSLLDVAVESMVYNWAEYALKGQLPVRRGSGQPHVAPGADIIATADGSVVVSAYVDSHFARLTSSIGRPGLAQDPRFSSNAARVANREAMLTELAAVFSQYTTADICDRLGAAGIVVAAVRTFDKVRTDPNGVSPDLFVELKSPSKGTFEVPARPYAMDGLPPPPTRLPALGEDTEAILRELGRTRD